MNDLTDTQISDLRARLAQRGRELKQEIREILTRPSQRAAHRQP